MIQVKRKNHQKKSKVEKEEKEQIIVIQKNQIIIKIVQLKKQNIQKMNQNQKKK